MKLIVFSVVLIAGIFWTRSEGANSCPDDDPEEPVFLPHETNCWQYYECSGGEAMLSNCSNGLYWNNELDTCDYPEDVKCGSLSTTTPHDLPTTEPTSLPSDSDRD